MSCPIDEFGSFPIGMSDDLKNKTIFTSLDKCYRFFSYGFGPDITNRNRILVVQFGIGEIKK